MIEPGTLHAIAHAVRRLSPSHRDPERFHADKSEIEQQLRRLARQLERAHLWQPGPTIPPDGNGYGGCNCNCTRSAQCATRPGAWCWQRWLTT